MRISIKGIWFLSGGEKAANMITELSMLGNKFDFFAQSLIQGTL